MKGFTLIELAVVLAIIAILAAVMTPMVTGYIDEARITRAAGDARALATAVIAYQRDTSFFPVFSSRANANSDTLDSGLETLVGTGDTPTNGSGGAAWTLTSTGSLETFLNTNQLSLPTSSSGGRIAYLGPYIELAADPWGNAYVVNAAALTRASTDYGFVLSAGPNGTIETDPTQARTGAFTVGGDDVAGRVR